MKRRDLLKTFAAGAGLLALTPLITCHCHNLEHEDGGMMRNCLFEAET